MDHRPPNKIDASSTPGLRSPPWRGSLRAPDETGSQPEGTLRILVIEDDLLIASQIENSLSEAGFDVVGIATTGVEALELAKARSPVLAVADIRLAGGRDGIDTALELFRLHNIRCIFASAHSDKEARRRAEPAAPFGWLQKPYTMTSLTAMVRAAADDLSSR